MDFKTKPIDIETIVADDGIQVRERLDEEHIADLVAVIEDNRAREIPAVVVFFDGSIHWLADGFHRRAAHVRAASQKIMAEVRHGSKDEAKFFAAGANTRNGMRLTGGDKARAIRLLHATAKGSKMGPTEIARHVGCSRKHVHETLGVSPGNTTQHPVVSARDLKRAAIEATLRAHPERSNQEIADAHGAHRTTVYAIRKELAIPEPPANNTKCDHETIDRLLRGGEHTHQEIADSVGVSTKTVGVRAKAIGIDSRAERKKQRQPRAPHPNDSAERLNARPPKRYDDWLLDMQRLYRRGTDEQRAEFREWLTDEREGERAA